MIKTSWQNLSLLAVVVNLLVSAVSWAAPDMNLPDGLCLLVSRSGGSGQAFIIGDYLVSSAHGLAEEDIAFVYCVQDRALRNVTDLWSGKPIVDPMYKNEDLLFPGLNTSQFTPPGLKTTKTMGKWPFDLAVVRLKHRIHTDFVLSGADTFSEEATAYGDHDMFVARIDSKDSDLQRQFAAGSSNLSLRGEVTKVGAISPLGFHYNSQLQRLDLSGESIHSSRANVLVENSMTTQPGHSGMPLFVRLKDGECVVMGVGIGVASLPDYPWPSPRGYQTIFAMGVKIKPLIHPAVQVGDSPCAIALIPKVKK